jgi:hypothetical protein
MEHPSSGSIPDFLITEAATGRREHSRSRHWKQTLAHELVGTGVKVQVCLPGRVTTEFHTSHGMDIRKIPAMMSPADLVAGSLAALARGEVVCIPGLEEPAMFEKIGEAQRAVIAAANKPGDGRAAHVAVSSSPSV